jgi:hypothetical protein
MTMNFGNLGEIGGSVAGYLATPEGQDAIKKFLASPEGIAMLKNFVGSPEGQKTMLGILPQVLGALNLPPGVTDTVKGALSGQQ